MFARTGKLARCKERVRYYSLRVLLGRLEHGCNNNEFQNERNSRRWR